ncbi:DUF2066 domain-containing protein [Paraneptunicella aestuarii]|uniref:DUF2066 domain-containing protein n=1 Tax=Paraneptunicella aestuarii TaxID=2831148 RepID=UPI001E63CC49|nr:DUF2066 domain-containing protein [Paraneptunicella aestuarii]UAA40333.1 DUF2066 domain-containing protein [Paraneptunicella aestuarii]
MFKFLIRCLSGIKPRVAFTTVYSVAALFATGVAADVVTGLYEARVPVSSQSNSAQQIAIQQAFGQVLIKVSGTKAILDSDDIKDDIKRARQYVRQYQFENENNELYLVASYEPEKVDNLIRNSNFPIWGSYRPATLIWLAEESENLERQLYSEHTETELKSAIQKGVKRRGLSLVFPVLDLSDLNQAGLYDVWGQFTDNIVAASSRYNVEAVMSARVYPEQNLDSGFVESNAVLAGSSEAVLETTQSQEPPEQPVQIGESVAPKPTHTGWQSDWLILQNGEFKSGTLRNDDKQALAQELMDILADKLASQYAVKSVSGGNGNAQAVITIRNLDSLTAYVQATRYFESLSAVTSAQLVSLNGQQGVYHLSLVGQLQDLLSVLQLDDKVQRLTDAFGRPTSELEFTWNP